MTGLPWTITDDGVLLSVRLTPKGGRDQIDGIETLADGRAVLKARVRAVPEDGEANAALIKLLAKTCQCPASSIRLVSGATSRVKIVALSGDPAIVERILARMFQV
jgi:uncharacterized protein (TIGR00251 family)